MASDKITNLSVSQILLIPPYYGIMSYKILNSAIKKFSPNRSLLSFTPRDVCNYVNENYFNIILPSKIIVFDFYIYYFVYPSLPYVCYTSVHHLVVRRKLTTHRYRCKIWRHSSFQFSPFFPKQQSELVVSLTG